MFEISDPVFGAIGESIIKAIQVFSPLLDPLFLVLTFLGDKIVVILGIAIVYWSVDRRWGLRLAVVASLSNTVNVVMKDVLGHSRPYHDNPQLLIGPSSGEAYGIPSGHTQTPTAIATYLSLNIRKWAPAFLLFAFLIGFSRMYLGVHWPGDVVAGWTFGGTIGILVFWAETNYLTESRKELFKSTQVIILGVVVILSGLVLSTALILALGNDPLNADPGAPFGIILGLFVTYPFVEKYANFSTVQISLETRVMRVVIGLVLMVVVYLVPSLLLGSTDTLLDIPISLIRYFLLVVAGFLVVPLVFPYLPGSTGEQ